MSDAQTGSVNLRASKVSVAVLILLWMPYQVSAAGGTSPGTLGGSSQLTPGARDFVLLVDTVARVDLNTPQADH